MIGEVEVLCLSESVVADAPTEEMSPIEDSDSADLIFRRRLDPHSPIYLTGDRK